MAIVEMTVLDHSGDTKVTWDPEVATEVEAARTTFTRLSEQGYRGYLTAGKKGNKTGAQMTDFDPQAGGLVMMVPPMVAG